ncbi:MAG: hypothetical protein AABY84_11265 [Candidatus Firestonebacteria bacterium]
MRRNIKIMNNSTVVKIIIATFFIFQRPVFSETKPSTGNVSKNNIASFSNPFASTSIWNKKISANTNYVDVQDAIWGDSTQAPNTLYTDLVGVYYVDNSQPLVNFRLNQGWNYPERSKPRGEVLFQKKIALEDGTEFKSPKNGNGNFVIIDLQTGIAVEGSAGWRESGGDFLMFENNEKFNQNIDVINGNGLVGTGGSGLPVLGGLITQGELNSGVNHAVAVALSSRRYSKDVFYVWPATRNDSFASNSLYGYLGNNSNYTMGTLLAIPNDFNLDSVTWKTIQGKNLAKAAQTYGWYIVDSGTGEAGGNIMAFGIERKAASVDLGMIIDS